MLVINKGQTKNWYVTLTEKASAASATYLFSITHLLTNTVTNFILIDVSTHKERYNKFEIVENTYNLYTGEYQYKVYAQNSPVNLNPLLSDELVEQGILKVNNTELVEVFYEPT